eukprot:6181070-Pleurochrysis_carterae.AAC.2
MSKLVRHTRARACMQARTRYVQRRPDLLRLEYQYGTCGYSRQCSIERARLPAYQSINSVMSQAYARHYLNLPSSQSNKPPFFVFFP